MRSGLGHVSYCQYQLGTPVVHFFLFYFGVYFLKLNVRKRGTLMIKGLLGNLDSATLGFPDKACPQY